MKSCNCGKKIVIIDSNSIIHRAYHALPRLTTKSGVLVNAVYGFLLVFLKTIGDFSPDFMVAAFDLPAPTFRHKLYKGYKAKRPKAPPELYAQIPLIKDFLKEFRVKIFEKEGFEADDIIGTIAGKTSSNNPDVSVVILSGDSDSFQLVNPCTKICILKKGVKDVVLCDEKTIADKFGGLNPGQLLDFKSLRGDSSDNIAGVKGIGDKTAIQLLSDFGTLENLYDEIKMGTKKSEKIKDKIREALIKFKESAFLSKELARIEKNVPVDFRLEECVFGGYSKEEIIKKFQEFGFGSLIKRIDGGPVGLKKEKTAHCDQGKLL